MFFGCWVVFSKEELKEELERRKLKEELERKNKKNKTNISNGEELAIVAEIMILQLGREGLGS